VPSPFLAPRHQPATQLRTRGRAAP
jgi:hypothetical protein